MGRVSKKPIDKEIKDSLEEQLSFIISSLIKKEEINFFLDEFLTKEEKVMLGKRLVLHALLYKGMPTSSISRILSMSRETIRWYSVTITNKSNLFKKTIQKLLDKEKNEQLWKKIEKMLEPFSLFIESRNNMKARAKLAGGEFWKDDE